MEIFVFRTGINKHEEIKTVAPILNSIRGITKWNFDLDDHENILRIEAAGISPRSIEDSLLKANYYCEELPD
jgi:hypothetical protein